MPLLQGFYFTAYRLLEKAAKSLIPYRQVFKIKQTGDNKINTDEGAQINY